MTSYEQATRDYRRWLADRCPVHPADFAAKDAKMRKKGVLSFMRGTFHRWMQLWPAGDDAPVVSAIADIHLENFGSWRDAQGGAAWGVNDFDEAIDLPYTQDLVRLMTSVRLAIEGDQDEEDEDDDDDDDDDDGLDLEPSAAAAHILAGYTRCLEAGGLPMALADASNDWLERITARSSDPIEFWSELDEDLAEGTSVAHAPEAWAPGLALLEAQLPERGMPYRAALIRRGTGSLGRVRFGAVTRWQGARVAREVKALAPSAVLWARGSDDRTIHVARILGGSRQVPDPSIHVEGAWFARAIAPESQKINLDAVTRTRDLTRLMEAMGQAVANVHLGSGNARAVLDHLAAQPRAWLLGASSRMKAKVLADWESWA